MMKNYKTIITHNGVFHADECFAIAFIVIALGRDIDDFNIYRVNKVPDNIDEDTIVLDIGGGEFDHHGGYQEGRIYNNHFYKFASFGKVVRKFWGSVFRDEKEYRKFDRDFVSHIDAYDCGDRSFFSDISVSIKEMNPEWDSQPKYIDNPLFQCEYKDVTTNFMRAVDFSYNILKAKIAVFDAARRAYEYVRMRVEQAENHTLIIDKFVPYSRKPEDEIFFMLFPSDREPGTFNLTVMKDKNGEFIHPLPQEWWGYNREGNPPVKGLLFCHSSGFMAVFDSIENSKEAIAGILA